jgi:glycosyltransferase involved in cell wall biosynthesis
MKIIFDLRRVGLGNNGGSSTLIKSGNTLVDMGHEVFFIDSMKNQHKWTPLKAEHIMINDNVSKIPNADIIIATGYKSIGPTVKAPDKCGVKTHWIRGWETWQMSESDIVKRVLQAPTIKLVNSMDLKYKLEKYKCRSYLVRPGYDFGELYPTYTRDNKKEVVLGGIYLSGQRGSRKRTHWLFNTARQMKTKYGNVKFFLFGNENYPGDNLIDKYIKRPNMKEKNLFYNSIDIWMAPSYLEGLHIPPAEAMMTGCPVVSTKAEMSGVRDYIVDGESGILSKNDMIEFLKNVEYLYNNVEYRKKLGRAAIKSIENIGDRKKNMQIMIDLFGEFIK